MTFDPLSLFPLIHPSLPEEYAIGGAYAMAAHGYVRNTEDLDVFLLHTDCAAVLGSLRRRGVRFATIMEPYQYAIIPDVEHPDRRVDLLFTSDDVEVDAVRFPDDTHTVRADAIGGPQGAVVTINVFPLDLLVVAKVMSDRDKDHRDVRAMNNRGLVDGARIVKLLRGYGEKKPRQLLNMILEE